MAKERERKFRVTGDGWQAAPSRVLVQGYLPVEGTTQVRVRLIDEREARLTIKGAGSGIERDEFEYPIPVEDAREMLEKLCRTPLLEKRRHRVEHAGHGWEVDVFAGANEGLVLAEIELASVETTFERPPWLGDEVTDDPRYLNANLVRHPYRAWGGKGSTPPATENEC